MCRSASVLILSVAVAVCASRAAAAPSEVWGELRLAGGAGPARAAFGLGASEGRFDAAWALDFVRRYGKSGLWSESVSQLRRYLATVALIEKAFAAAPDGVRPPPPGATIDAVEGFRSLAAAMGLDVRPDAGRLRVVVSATSAGRERARWSAALGLDADDVAGRWNTGESVSFTVRSSTLPLPLPGYWVARAGGPTLTPYDVLRDVQSGLLYAGLMALDQETLNWFDGHRDVIERIGARAPAVFAAYSGTIHIRDGVVDVPGGRAAWAAWQATAGQSPVNPGAFVPALLELDHGKAALFFDAVAHAPAATAAAIADSAAQRPSEFGALYHAFRDAAVGWSPEARPFDRPSFDPAWALDRVDMRGSTLSGPAWLPAVLDRVVALGSWPTSAPRLPEPLPVGDVQWLARWLFAQPSSMVDRVRLLAYAQRLSGLDHASAYDVELALLTLRDLPTLAWTLERLPIGDPAIIARVGQKAYTLSRSGEPNLVVPILARWQASLALLEQSSRFHHFSDDQMSRLVLALADTVDRPARLASDAIVQWVTNQFMPALEPGLAPRPLTRETLSRAVTSNATRVSPVRVTWEGLAYERSPLRVASRDLEALARSGLQASDLDLQAFDAARRRLDQGLHTPQDARDLASEFDALRASSGRAEAAPQGAARVRERLDAAATALRRRPVPQTPADVEMHFPEIYEVFGVAADAVIQPVVYALAMTPLHQPAALEADAWSFHRLVTASARGRDWWRAAWRRAEPELRPGGGSALVGSWLTLDLALADAIVPRRFEQVWALPETIREAIFRDVAIRVHAPVSASASLEGAVNHLTGGRALVAGWSQAIADTAEVRRRLTAINVGPTRTNIALWTLARDPAALAAGLTTGELARLDGDAGPWVASEALDGCVCLVRAPLRDMDDIRASWRSGATAVLVNDLPLSLAAVLTAEGLPLVLVDDLVPLVTADWLAHIEPYTNDDWEALTLWPRRLTRAEVEGYLLQLVAGGILVPDEGVAP
jgi:hypothetical protein